MFEYLDMQPKVALHGGVVLPTHSVKGNVSFENVTFAYLTRPDQVRCSNFPWEKEREAVQWNPPPPPLPPSHPPSMYVLLFLQAVLEGLSLDLPAGKVTALCGLSGAGEEGGRQSDSSVWPVWGR